MIDLSRLAEWASDARYPGERPEPTRHEAEQALTQARTVLDRLRADFEARGRPVEA